MNLFLLRLLIILIRSMPTLWVGWTAKTLIAWYYGPSSKLGAANPGNAILSFAFYSGLVALVVMLAQGFAPDGSLSKALGNIQYLIFRLLRAGWKVTTTQWKEAAPDETPAT